MVRVARINNFLYLGGLAAFLAFTFAAVASAANAPGQGAGHDLARQILQATGVKGGLIVHLACGDGKLTAALRANNSYLVHGLDTDPKNVQKARKTVQSLGLYGNASVDLLRGKQLPYIDNLVNLVVAEDLGDVAMDEVIRVLSPEGVAYVQQGNAWTKTVKPRPKEIDRWTHYMYDAGGNAVAHDSVVGPPRRLQWLGSPRWSRHHDHMSSVSACVSSGKRVFYIFDEAPRVSILTPPNWKLIARDAFNGTILWKRPIPKWYTHLMGLKSGPAILPRRLVAVGERVYVTLGIDAPVTALDAATGETVLTYKGTDATQELIVSDGVIFLVANKPADENNRTPMWELDERRLTAVQADTGKVLWQKDQKVLPMTLAADSKQVYLHDGGKIVCRDRTDGRPLWTSQPLARWMKPTSNFGAILLVHDGVVLFAGGEKMVPHRGGEDTMTALNAEDGKLMWTADHPPSGYQSPEDMLVAGGMVWTGATTNGGYSGVFTGRDLKTGEVKVEFPPDVKTYWFHHRCHRGKATDNFLLMSRTGIEVIDFRKQHWQIHHWVRGACLYGIMPCNGLIYAPQHPCACYPEAKQYGFSALAPAAGATLPKPPNHPRLEEGPAYEEAIGDPSSKITGDWPTFRGNAARSGWTKTAVSTDLTPAWQTQIGGRLSSVVVAEGKLLVASVDDHTVHALNAGSGKRMWSYTTGGRVDSPPTVYQGRAIFGSADGYVYCLRAADGELIWRFRAAPDDRRLVSFEQVESVWPVHGSVLVLEDRVYCVAGRSMFLDGGLRMLQLDVKTGRKIGETFHNDRDPETDEDLQTHVKVLNMPVALPDVLSSDGKQLFMRSQPFDLKGNREGIPHRYANDQIGEGMHLFSPTGFLDGSYWHRTYWVYGRGYDGGHGGYHVAGRHAPAGKILVHDDDTVYGFGRKAKYYRWTTPIEHHMFADVRGEPRRSQPAKKPADAAKAADAPKIAASAKGAKRNGAGGPWVVVENAPSLNPAGKALAVEAWVKSDTDNGVVIARGGPSHGYAIILQDGRPQFVVRADAKISSVAAKENVTGKWAHLAGVLTPDAELKIYVDGKLSASAKGTGLIPSDPAQTTEIGADDEGSVGDYPAPFAQTGLVDEVRVYFGTVTDAEIAEHATTPGKAQAKDAKLVLCLTFDKDASDASGNKNHGQAKGMKISEGKFGSAVKLAAVAPKGRPRKRRGRATPTSFVHRWAEDVPMIVRAMVLADRTLFIVGPPDLVDEEAARKAGDNPEIQERLAQQNDAWYGKKGSLLWALSADDGKKLAEYELDAAPVFDSMAAAYGRLYFTTTDGRVRCYAGTAPVK